MFMRLYETADFQRNAKPLRNGFFDWYHRQCDELKTQGRYDELAELRAGFDGSTFLRGLEESSTGQKAGIETDGIERRIASLSAARNALSTPEPRAENGKGSQKKLIGYAALFDTPSLLLWPGYIEKIERGAFTETLKTSDTRGLFNHESNKLLGRSSAKSLRLYQDSIGLKFFCDLLDDNTVSKDVFGWVNRGDVTGCSFAFTVKKERWILKSGQTDLRVIEVIDGLYDVGPVAWPAYPDTSVSVLIESKRAYDGSDIDDDKDDVWADVEREHGLRVVEDKIRESNLRSLENRIREARLRACGV